MRIMAFFAALSLMLSVGVSKGSHNASDETDAPSKIALQHSRCDRNMFQKHFYQLAKKLSPVTDKVTVHQYEVMYGMFLVPLRFAAHRPKIMEIGLGCDMRYGPGASVQVWKSLLPKAELWEAEYDKACVDKSRKAGSLDGINTVTGDQGKISTLEVWKKEIGDDFDVIIDDGGHKQSQIDRSFDALWSLVKPGGVYVVEDLQESRSGRYDDTHGEEVFVDKVKDWMEQILTRSSTRPAYKVKFPIPEDISFIFCQLEACVIGKHNSEKEWGVPGHVGHDILLRVRRYLRGEQVPVNATTPKVSPEKEAGKI